MVTDSRSRDTSGRYVAEDRCGVTSERLARTSRYRAWHAQYERLRRQRLKSECPEAYEEWKRKHRCCSARVKNKAKDEVFHAYGNRCACCGETRAYFLVVDHINGNGASERAISRRTGKNLYMKLKQEGFPGGYQLLCANCNHAKGAGLACPCRGKRWE